MATAFGLLGASWNGHEECYYEDAPRVSLDRFGIVHSIRDTSRDIPGGPSTSD